MRYRKVSTRLWADDRFRRLSGPAPNAQSLFVYLIAGPHTTSLPGLFVAGDVVKGLDQISNAMGQAGVASTTIRNMLSEQRAIWR